ncbi:MAG: hypothetical protein AAFX06_32755 [Planctomycetota bacterium]
MDASHEDTDYNADELVQYFRARIAEHSRPEYELGLQHTLEWQRRRDDSTVTQAEFDDFIRRIETVDSAGSAYAHLWVTVRNWAYDLELRVPKSPPPHLTGYRHTATCITDDRFTGQLTVNSTYNVLELDTDRSLVRISNDESKHRWYPVNHFTLSVPPEREYVRKPDW